MISDLKFQTRGSWPFTGVDTSNWFSLAQMGNFQNFHLPEPYSQLLKSEFELARQQILLVLDGRTVLIVKRSCSCCVHSKKQASILQWILQYSKTKVLVSTMSWISMKRTISIQMYSSFGLFIRWIGWSILRQCSSRARAMQTMRHFRKQK